MTYTGLSSRFSTEAMGKLMKSGHVGGHKSGAWLGMGTGVYSPRPGPRALGVLERLNYPFLLQGLLNQS